ncbi:HIT family protein [Sulfurirhabdus autotrophica]|uniref:Diadenosine tetraphosphate (Ap4A) HIT family hydrolase n=1 Tax=Sulfurirhabdus autotrophica TaxID=1706046 RepID=A0A4R3Y8A5_9PROT|nr:HIT family protein [Sulfurirhabdus autotrophica]TCV88096.1 diadenosine tetraphosphate (Ap4A) HIT family hydrolase [Sulfurirhabdus autotrophica]
MTCELCDQSSGELLWQDELCRVIWVNDPDYPGFCRVIWKAHVKEMTDLPPQARVHLMSVVFAVEQAIREVLTPDKINLASLGNVVPHLHWHVIPRFNTDRHFPNPIWGTPMREPLSVVTENLKQKLQNKIHQICV